MRLGDIYKGVFMFVFIAILLKLINSLPIKEGERFFLFLLFPMVVLVFIIWSVKE